MVQKVFNLPESTSRTQTHKITIPGLKEIENILVNTGAVTIEKIEGEEVTIRLTSGTYSRRVQTGGSYTTADSKYIDGTTRGYASESSIPLTISYNSGGYSGTLTIDEYSRWPHIYGESKPWVAWYSGTVTRPESDTRTWRYYYQYNVTVNYIFNAIPTITLGTTDNRILYENDTLVLTGNAKDEDVGNEVTVKYSINGGTTRTIATAISDGGNIPFNKTLIFKQNKLYDGDTAITAELAEGTQHTLKVWAEDDQGGKSTEETRVFYVVPNRPPRITGENKDLGNIADGFKYTYSVTDPDNDVMTVTEKLNGTVTRGVTSVKSGSEFTFDIPKSKIESLGTGSHKMEIVVSDGKLTTSRVVTFSISNVHPTVSDSSDDGRVIKKGDAISVSGFATDSNKGDEVTVFMYIQGKTYEIAKGVSDGNNKIEYDVNLDFKGNKLHLGDKVVAEGMRDGAEQEIYLYATDDKGWKSDIKTISFSVKNNNPPIVTPDSKELGLVKRGFEVPIVVADPEGDAISVTVNLNGEIFNEYEDNNGRVFETITVPDEAIYKMEVGEEGVVEITASDDEGLESRSRITFTRDITIPVIQGEDADIGDRDRAFGYDLIAVNGDGGKLKYTVSLNGVEIESGESEDDGKLSKHIKISEDNFDALKVDAVHNIVISVSNEIGRTTKRTIKFTKVLKRGSIDSPNDLGDISELKYTFTVLGDYDADIIFKIDGREVGYSSGVKPGVETTFIMPQDLFSKLLNKSYSLEAEMTTEIGVESKFIKFTKVTKADSVIKYLSSRSGYKYAAAKYLTDGRNKISYEDISALMRDIGNIDDLKTENRSTIIDSLNEIQGTKPSRSVASVKSLKAEVRLLDSSDKVVDLTWSDPEDAFLTTSDGIKVPYSKWNSTVIVRTLDKAAEKPEDGVLVAKVFQRNSHTTKPFTDASVTPGTTYYYTLFTLSDSGGYSKGVSVSADTSGTPVGEITKLEADAGDAEVELTWSDPSDDNWLYTVVVRRLGREPKSVNDGDVVKRSRVRNQHSKNPLVDRGLLNDADYYYKLFTISKSGGVSKGVSVKATPVDSFMYGFEIDENNSNPKTAVKYIGDNAGFTPARVSNLNSWEEMVKDLATPVVLKNGKTQYELQHNNRTKKKDGSSATLTGSDGDVMIRFKHLWVKEEKIASRKRRVWLSDAEFEGATSYTKMTERGYNQLSWGILMTLQHLYLLLYKDRDSQTALGRGRADGESGYSSTGGTNTKSFCYGSQDDEQIAFLGIEDFWGNKLQWVDGIVSDINYNLKVGYNDFNDTGSNYKLIRTPQSSNYYGYFKTTMGGEAGYILADDGDGSSSTGYCDYGYLRSGTVAHFGGYRDSRSNAGVFNVWLIKSASSVDTIYGARLCFVDDDYFYIGAYLGYVQNGKLRSISREIPTERETIGEFRKYAQANN